MTLHSQRGRAPRTDAEWARDIQRRIEALESATTLRIGAWVLSVVNGHLVASRPGTAPVVLAESTFTALAAQTALTGRGEATGSTSSQ